MSMSTSTTPLPDPLLALRASLSPQSPQQPTLLTSPTPTPTDTTTTTSLTTATHLHLPLPSPTTYPLSTPTRFISAAAGNIPIDLRSIYFAWLRRDVAIPEYIAEAQGVNEELSKKGGGDGDAEAKVLNLVFVERLDLITWLEGAGEDSEYIKPLEAGQGQAGVGAVSVAQAQAEDSARVAAGVAGGVSVVGGAGAGVGTQVPAATAVGKGGRTIDPRLQEIYNGERKMGDRNSVLRGIRPTDFSHVRKTAEIFLGRNTRSRTAPHKPGAAGSKQPPTTTTTGSTPTSGAGSIIKQPAPPTGRSTSSPRPNPIILLSPSASSLLRMSNIRSFLSDGIYVPPDHPTLATSTTDSNLLHILRDLHSIPGGSSTSTKKPPSSSTKDTKDSTSTRHNNKPTRFILVDSTADFKPDYWSRVVAVFTTGQTWQFKSYKWSDPPELFKHAMGIYVGWRGEEVPREVRGWGRGVRSFAIDRWDEKAVMAGGNIGGGGGGGNGVGVGVGVGGMSGRWRDRGVVEGIWTAIEEGMKARGWGGGK
ncbi:accessory factor associated with RNA polymerase II [Onygenales sp. PD_40]|nr:accessory factor associated with RNA polymerase II [Onygenales sp. PD_40]